MDPDIIITVASEKDLIYVHSICQTIAESASARGTGIAGRTPDYICQKILDGKAIIAIQNGRKWVGFGYMEIWGNGQYVSHSGLIVDNVFRQQGIAQHIKEALFQRSRCLFPKAKIFSITTSQAVMTLNTQLGFRPVAFSELPQDERFWQQCSSCKNCDILARTGRNYCLCTGMLYDPTRVEQRATYQGNNLLKSQPERHKDQYRIAQ